VTVTFAPVLPAASALEPSVPWLPIGGLAIGLTIILFGLRRRRATA
jgi:LPXTG-motif cell wall-anchored protein